MKDLKIRCHELWKIMGNGRGDFGLTETAITLVKEKVKQHLYHYKSTIESKYLTKGIETEDQIREMYNGFFFTNLEKNTERKSNDWIEGEPDAISDKIIDFKSAWSSETFPASISDAEKKIKKAGYEAQLRGYMWLWGLDSAELVYGLVDTPEYLIEWEQNRSIHEVEHLAVHLRLTCVQYERDKDYEMLIKSKVEDCRKFAEQYMKEIESKHLKHEERNI
jgi:hypothetical protein